MTASPPFWAVWTDVLWCLGIGLCFGESRPVRFVLDLAGFAAAAVAVCGFAAQLSASGTARWYMAAAMALGTLGWSVTASPLLHRGMELLLRILAFPLHWTAQKVVQPIKRKLIQAVFSAKQKHSRRKQGKKRKKQKKMLQNPKRILYN